MLTLQKPQTTCSDCPIWQASSRTPNSGYCPRHYEQTLGHDKAGPNCPQPLNTYKVDLFQDGEWVEEVTIKAANIREVNAAILAMGDYASNQPRLCRRR